MSDSNTGQVNANAAEVYEEFFLPALFQEWAPRVAEAANIQPGQSVLDVACGTGVLTREVATRVGASGSVVGLDVNEGMLAVAKRKAPAIEWRLGAAEELPFENECFDAVVSQFGLMFFTDRRAALSEMMRVLRPGGQLAVVVWDTLDNTVGYAALGSLLQRLFGDQFTEAFGGPFVLGDKAVLASIFAEAGISKAQITTQTGTVRFPSIDSWLYTEIKGWVLADQVTDTQFDQLLTESRKVLQPFVAAEGSVTFPAPAHIVTARKE